MADADKAADKAAQEERKAAEKRAKQQAAVDARRQASRAKEEERKAAQRAKAEKDKVARLEKEAKAEAKAAVQREKDKAKAERDRLRSLKGDKSRKVMLDLLVVAALLALVAVVVAAIGILPLDIAQQTYALAAATAILAGCSYLFNTIRWSDIRREEGHQVLNRGKADLQLTIVSIVALVTVVLMAVIEFFALLVFTGAISDVGSAGLQFAANFVLFQTIMLLVYLGALVVRENTPSHFEPKPGARLAANVLTPLAGVAVLLGVLLASGAVELAGIQVHQAVYVVTLGVLIEFVAMRIRLRLPSLWSLFSRALAQAKRPTDEMKDVLRKRAQRTYVAGAIFVAMSMAFAGAIATGAVGLGGNGIVLSLVIFYVGTAVILLGLVGIRLLQTRALAPKKEGADELSRLVSQRRRSPEDVLRISVYSVAGFFAFVAALLSVLTGFDKMPWHHKYATDLFILAVMFAAGPYGYFYNRELNRIAAVDNKFPDFLRDLAESARAGMTLPRALVTASQGSYGALTPEIKVMAAQVEWGVEFGDALARFAIRCKTPLIDRTVALVVEAQRAGGSVVDVLTAASEDAREIKQIVSERNTQMSMYNVVIYISFFVFIVVVLVLAGQFIPAFKKAVGAASGQQVGGLRFIDFDPDDFNTIFFQAAVVQAIGGGLVGGVLTKGNAVSGFIHIAVMLAAAWLSFRVLVGLMG
ncbi:MAG TPA: type II secretion system F family protein [Candidatus Thermoplasmatota archaeon]|nr:type II secretion system F family protein [Candidatus Thermoplasmatota archaeon]